VTATSALHVTSADAEAAALKFPDISPSTLAATFAPREAFIHPVFSAASAYALAWALASTRAEASRSAFTQPVHSAFAFPQAFPNLTSQA